MANKLKNLVLHIGNSKTGTSSIQKCLADNSHELSASGVLYPNAGRQGDAHHPVASLMSRGSPSWVSDLSVEKYLRDIKNELADGRHHTVILSSEIFWQAHDYRLIQAAFGAPRITVVAFVRRQDLWAESIYRHQLKTSLNVESPIEWIERRPHAFNYSIALGRWAFQLDNVSMRVIDFDLACRQGLMHSFAQSVSLASLLGDALALEKVNVSLADEALQLLREYRIFYQRNDAFDEQVSVCKILENYTKSLAGQIARNKYIGHHERAKIAVYSRSGNEWLQKVTKGRIKFDIPLAENDELAGVSPSGDARIQLERFLQRCELSSDNAKEKHLCAKLLEVIAQNEQLGII